MDDADVRVVDRSGGSRFLLQLQAHLWQAGQMRRWQLQRHRPAQTCVFGEEDLAHPAFAELPQDPVAADDRWECHRALERRRRIDFEGSLGDEPLDDVGRRAIAGEKGFHLELELEVAPARAREAALALGRLEDDEVVEDLPGPFPPRGVSDSIGDH